MFREKYVRSNGVTLPTLDMEERHININGKLLNVCRGTTPRRINRGTRYIVEGMIGYEDKRKLVNHHYLQRC